MKNILILLPVLFFLHPALAQIELGIKAGMNFTNISGSDFEDSKTRLLFHGGTFIRFLNNENIKIQPELLFSQYGATVNTFGTEWKYTQNYLHLPVMVQYHTGSGLYGETGPQLGVHLKTKSKNGDFTYDWNEGVNLLDFAWCLGIGYQLPKKGVGISMRYNLGLSKVFEKTPVGQAVSYHRVLNLGMFYILNTK